MDSWINNAIVYHILIDRFAGCNKACDDKKPEFCGGNLKAITTKLDYIKSLGINTIWISPFYETTVYRGYHITDFDKVDKRFGTIEDLKELINACKEKQIRIIADIVPNHCSVKHPWFIDAVDNPQSVYKNWFYFTKWPEKYFRFMEFDELPKINLENPVTAEYMINSLVNWAKLGFDGFRIDHVIGIPDKFLINLRKRLLKINPYFLLIGEAWTEGIKYRQLKTLRLKGRYNLWRDKFKQADVQKHYEGIIDGVFDFEWRTLVLRNKNLLKSNPQGFKKLMKKHRKYFSDDFILPKFFDNHDTNRLMFECRNNVNEFKLLLGYLLSEKGPRVLYYGSECGLSQPLPVLPQTPYSDLNARAMLPDTLSPAYYQFISDKIKENIRF